MAALGGTVVGAPERTYRASWGNPPLVDGFKDATDSSVAGGSGTPSGRSSVVGSCQDHLLHFLRNRHTENLLRFLRSTGGEDISCGQVT
jgi:hypothetical protein